MFEQIKKHATHFSEQIRNECKHLDEVTVAGQIKTVIPPILDDLRQLSSHYVLEIDDKVGTIYVYVSPLMKNHFEFLELGNYVALSGYVNIVLREVHNETQKDYSVVAYDAKQLDLKAAI